MNEGVTTHVTQFRPIACCNVLYKCISKLICNRLAEVLPEIISLNQGGFIKGWSIIENILMCQDLVRLYNRQACSPRCMFKMDLMKAYDSVSLDFLRELLIAFNFPNQFGELVIECVISATFSISLNGETFGFCPASGLRINAQKSCVYFNGVSPHLKKDIRSISGFIEGKLPFKYLGVPITAGRLKKKDFALLIDKIVARLRSLGAKNLSYAGRLVLVSSVLSTMHNYWAAMFVLPKSVLKRLMIFAGISFGRVAQSMVKFPLLEAEVKGCYQWLRLKRNQVEWYRAIWCPVAVPKHNFIAWIIAHQALKLKARLMHTETHQHLFINCQFSQELLHKVGKWLGADISKEGSILTFVRRRWSKLRKSITTAAVIACWYFIWLQRNEARIHQCVTRPSIVASHLQEVIRSRFLYCKPVCISKKDVNWLSKVQLAYL
ncbi:uncharacterized protein LOC141628673 [Silene latifolia]|uniref:uncharacterized protein LOC141628673 n=1 Tax=Silene latifolia TaxID=37657 RepID=UPI003D77A271